MLWEPILKFLMACDDFAKKKEPILFWITGILYRLALDAVYIWAASPRAAYAGLILSPVGWKYLLSWGMYLILFYLLPRREKDTVVFLLHLQFMYTVAPLLTFYALADGSSSYILMVFVCVLLQIGILRRPILHKSGVYITGMKKSTTITLAALVVVSLIIPILYNGFAGLKAFDFTYIYEMRANAVFPPGFSYLFNWMQKAIIPFAVVYFLHLRKYGLSALCVLIQILFYIESGWKATLFILVPIIGIYILSQTGHLIKIMYVGVSIVLLFITVLFQRYLADNTATLGFSLCSLIPVRAFFIPADIKFDFYECFQLFPHVYFSDGMIGKFLGLTYPFSGSLGQVIYAFSGGTFLDSNSNTGYLGDSYAQMGFVGMLLMSLLLAAILRGLQQYENEKTSPILMALFAVSIIGLNDGALFTTLLTGGLLVMLILVMIYLDKPSEGAANGIQHI